MRKAAGWLPNNNPADASSPEKRLKLFLSTGDVSGDLHAALLVQALKKRDPGISFYAVGGENVKNAGAELVEESTGWSAVGFFDALDKVPRIYAAYRRLKKKLKKIRPDGLILIDTPAFNVPLSRYARSLKIRSVYFFPPSAWKRDFRRAANVGRFVEKVIAPFPETAELYAKAGVPAVFSGHPLVDLVPSQENESEIFREFGLDPRKPVIGLFPGSRKQEIRYLLPLVLDTAKILLEKRNNLQFVLPIAARRFESTIQKQLRNSGLPVTARCGINHACMQISTLLLVTSGTATLEAALHEKPMVIIYKVSPISWKLEKPFLKGVRFAGLPNLLANERIVPELIQEDATPEKAAREMELLFEPARAGKMVKALQEIRGKLGEPGVINRVADAVLELLSVKNG